MNVYIGNSLSEIKLDDYNIELSDDLIQHMYNNRSKIEIDSGILFEIDPYADSVVDYADISELYNICSAFIKAEIAKSYCDYDEADEALNDFCSIIESALKLKNGLVFIGD